MKHLALFLACLVGFSAGPAAAAVNIEDYIKKDGFNDIKLSPGGDYYAATVPLEDRTVLVILRRSDNKVTGKISGDRHTAISQFSWVSPDRLLVGMAETFGELARPMPTGELYSVNAKTGSGEILVGWRVKGEGLGTKIQPKKVELVSAFLVDDLPKDDKNVIIGVVPSIEGYTRAESMDVTTGRRRPIAIAPVRSASFVTDNAGVVRFAIGSGSDNVRMTYYRKGEGADWELISDEVVSRGFERPIGFSADNQTAYLLAERTEGPDAIVAFDVATRARKDVLRDDDVDAEKIIYANGTNIPVGAVFMDGKPRTAFFDESSLEAKLYRGLEAAFSGESVGITSQTSDGRLALVRTSSDRNPGDFYTFDTTTKKAAHLLSRRNWFDPETMASMNPITLKARDGLALHGYMTLPHGSTGKNLPMVVMPHGGPFGVQDVWGFDDSAQLLANAGYAVLQVNFRGSGGYGVAFKEAGAKQWGLKMQDDLTDATRWAISQGVADANRICIYGASYGGYASLMGVAKESTLYKCAVGYVGVYDLPTMHTEGDIQERGSGETYLREWIGERSELASTSPARLASNIKVPVFLAAGGEAERAPLKHSEMMEQALKKAGVPVETLYYDNEGHGFYLEAHRREYYTRLLAFLSRHLGGGLATTTAPAGKTGK